MTDFTPCTSMSNTQILPSPLTSCTAAMLHRAGTIDRQPHRVRQDEMEDKREINYDVTSPIDVNGSDVSILADCPPFGSQSKSIPARIPSDEQLAKSCGRLFKRIQDTCVTCIYILSTNA